MKGAAPWVVMGAAALALAPIALAAMRREDDAPPPPGPGPFNLQRSVEQPAAWNVAPAGGVTPILDFVRGVDTRPDRPRQPTPNAPENPQEYQQSAELAELWRYSEGKAWGAIDGWPWVYLREYGAAGFIASDPRLSSGSPIPGSPIVVLHHEQDRRGIPVSSPWRTTRRVDTCRAANGAILAWRDVPDGVSDEDRRDRMRKEWDRWLDTTVRGKRGDVYRPGARTPQRAGGGRSKFTATRWAMLQNANEAPLLSKRLKTESAASAAWAKFFTSAGTWPILGNAQGEQ